MTPENVDAALQRARADLRASMERQIDVDRALGRVRESIRTPDSERVLVAAAAPGGGGHEDDLLRLLYEQHAGTLLTFALRLTGGDRRRAEDVVRTALMRAWRDAHRLTGDGRSLRPWLIATVRRIATGDDQPPAVPGDPDRLVSDALGTLPPAYREILMETFFRGRTVTEAAQRLGLPPATAKELMYRALRALRTALEQA